LPPQNRRTGAAEKYACSFIYRKRHGEPGTMRSTLAFWLLLAVAAPAAAQGPPPSPPYAPPPSRIEELTPPPAPAQAPLPPPPAAALPSGPEPQQQGDIGFVSGGVGDDDRAALRQMAHNYNLRLQFAIQGSGEYLADVNVTLTDEKGRTLLDTISDGPLFFAKVPPGRYKITAAEGGRTLTRAVVVPADGPAAQAFYWPAAS
jgi:hypothetical protein